MSLPAISFVIASGNGHRSQKWVIWWFLRGGTTAWKDISCSDDEAIAYYLQVDSYDHTGESRFGSAKDRVLSGNEPERDSQTRFYTQWGTNSTGDFLIFLERRNWNNLLPWEMNSMGNWRKNVLILLNGWQPIGEMTRPYLFLEVKTT